jgi:hypothetical protein
MLIGKPVRRIESIVDLRLGIGAFTVGYLLQDQSVERLRPRRDWVSPVEAVRRRGQHRTQRKHRDRGEMAHDRLRFGYEAFSEGRL